MSVTWHVARLAPFLRCDPSWGRGGTWSYSCKVPNTRPTLWTPSTALFARTRIIIVRVHQGISRSLRIMCGCLDHDRIYGRLVPGSKLTPLVKLPCKAPIYMERPPGHLWSFSLVPPVHESLNKSAHPASPWNKYNRGAFTFWCES